MSEISETLGYLVKLQQLDSSRNAILKKISEIPARKKEISAELESKKSEVEEARKDSQKLSLDIKNKNAELEAAEALIRKHTTELNTIKTNQAYRALLDEIEEVKKRSSAIEDEILRLMEEVEKEKVEQISREKKLREMESAAADEIKSLDEENARLNAEAEALKKEREKLAASVKPEFLVIYEQMLRSRNGLAVVPLEDGGCGGCHMKLSVQNVNELMRVYSDESQSRELVRCENCSRILYFKNK